MTDRLFARRPSHPDKVQGPFSVEQVRKFARRGLLRRTDEVSSNRKDWFAASAIQPLIPFPEDEPLRSHSPRSKAAPSPTGTIKNPPRPSPFDALCEETRRLLKGGERTRAIGECRVGLECDFDTAHHIVKLIESGTAQTDIKQTMEKATAGQPILSTPRHQPQANASGTSAQKLRESAGPSDQLDRGCGAVVCFGIAAGVAVVAVPAAVTALELDVPPQTTAILVCVAGSIIWGMLAGSTK